ncbi:MAG: pilin [Patescibacteria group bacterium]
MKKIQLILIAIVALGAFALIMPKAAKADQCDAGKQCVTSAAAQCLMDCSSSPLCSGVCCNTQLAKQCILSSSGSACTAGKECVSSNSAQCIMDCSLPLDGSCAGTCCPTSISLTQSCLSTGAAAPAAPSAAKTTTVTYDKTLCDVPGYCKNCFPCPLGGGADKLPQIFGRVIRWVLGLVGALFFAMFVYGGFLYIIAGDNAKNAETGKKTLINAVIGLVIVITSYMVVTWIVETFTAGLSK